MLSDAREWSPKTLSEPWALAGRLVSMTAHYLRNVECEILALKEESYLKP